MSLSYVGAVIGLGVAGIDPVAAVLALSALSAGATRRTVVGFAAITVAVPVLLGIALSVTIRQGGAPIDLSGTDWESPWWAAVEAAVAVALLVWAVRRWRARGRPADPEGKAKKGRSGAGLLALGVLLGVGFVTDPTYLGVVVLAARADPVGLVVGHLGWNLISQAPLVLVGIAVATGRDRTALRILDRLSARFGPAARTALTVLLLVTGALLAADVITYVATGGTYLLA